ncbi:olfactory receptor 10A4-like [Denticeps clupeoides]|uniref:olfactory receptor 10A4-like n=1 Tax=Denticeps clupeoides TaxID=299321 RepID=UPI0010A5051B|nr:olfactory receptor 10A4-like [Denticeps clupeoides]
MSEAENWTTIKEFTLVGFPSLNPRYSILMAFIFFLVYATTIVGNCLLLLVYANERSLRKPMYGFMVSLALSDIGLSTVALPRIIVKYGFNNDKIPFSLCFMQMNLITYFITLSSLIMMLMAVDRYIAICLPLKYPVLMKNVTMLVVNFAAWLVSFIPPTIATVDALSVPYCGPNQIIQIFCDQFSITKLACADITYQTTSSFTRAIIVLMLPFAFIIFSYSQIIVSVQRITSARRRWKCFSTCSTQLCIIAIYYLPRCSLHFINYLGIYITPDLRIGLVFVCNIFPPFINPLIYFFRNNTITETLGQWACTYKLIKKSTVITISR